MIKDIYKFFWSVFLLVGVFFVAGEVLAASFTPFFSDTKYSGKYVNQSVVDPISISAGSSKEVTVSLKNTGKKNWNRTGNNFVSAYTVDPKYRPSEFFGKGWIGEAQPARIDKDTAPGETAALKIKLYAPDKAGDYMEKFYLAAEDRTWIKGSYFFLKIKVTPSISAGKSQVKVTDDVEDIALGNSTDNNDTAQEITADYKANLLFFSTPEIMAKGGEQINYLVRYLNRGSKQWTNYLWQEVGSRRVEGAAVSTDKISVADQSWPSANEISRSDVIVDPGKAMDINFNLRTPPQMGSYIARFQLTANGHTLEGGTLELPVKVTEDAPADYRAPTFPLTTTTPVLMAEPDIRVGLYKATEPVKFISDFPYTVYVGGEMKGVLPAKQTATLEYNDATYHFQSADLNFSADNFIRLVPDDPKNYFSLTNYKRLVLSKGKTNFNVYRGTLEFKYSIKSDVPYVVNALPLDLYVAGIAETSDGAAMEYIKAILVAARSYAYFNINNGEPPEKRTFDVVATTADQLYLGYQSELQMPNVAQATEATYGEMVTYNGLPITTPYFAHSNGQTKTWHQVWGGADKPWLQSVDCAYDAGLKQMGHGVGMSAHDAAVRADKDGWTYDQLLKYYYTGVEVEKIY